MLMHIRSFQDDAQVNTQILKQFYHKKGTILNTEDAEGREGGSGNQRFMIRYIFLFLHPVSNSSEPTLILI